MKLREFMALLSAAAAWLARAQQMPVIGFLSSASATRVAATRAFPQNSENFFYLCSMRAWQPRGESATNFAGPSCRQIATRGATARTNARASDHF